MLVYMLLVVVSLTSTSDVTVHAIKVTDPSQKSELLERHNILRAQEGSSDMEYMIWNDELAIAAENWAKVCKWEHNHPKPWPGGVKYGQNLFMSYGSRGRPINMTRAVKEWYDEKKGYDYETLGCSIDMCGHYTQVVWANTRQLGCAYVVDCKELTRLPYKANETHQIKHLVCNYLPPGNYPDTKPFKKGPACSNCGSGAGWCKDKLCNGECTGSGKDCACAAQCHNCAKLDEKTCRCSCAKGWTGADCRARCEDTDQQCDANPGWPPRWCNEAKYPYVKEKCPAMCKLCTPDPDAKENACEPVYGPNADKSTPYPSTASSLSVTMEEAMMGMFVMMIIVVSISSNAAL